MAENGNTTFHSKLKRTMDLYVHKTYDYSSTFPKEEIFGVTSQLRRATLSVILNYVEVCTTKKGCPEALSRDCVWLAQRKRISGFFCISKGLHEERQL